jgi:2-polyprenyl-3-methyl-5-hydroxy-6-metoxy-1,4-benzoquinol methylase
MYRDYFTHDTSLPAPGPLKEWILRTLIESEFSGQDIPWSVRLRASLLCLVPLAHETAAATMMWLRARPGGILVDVGCGAGEFLVRMKELGWEVAGVELDQAAAEIAERRLGKRVTRGALPDAGFITSSVDAVTANHVIEHMYDPKELLSEAHRILRPGGILVVTTPNIESLGHRVFKNRWRGLEPPRHLHLFSMTSLRKCALGAGFVIQEVRTTARSATEVWCFGRLSRQVEELRGGLAPHLTPRLKLGGLGFRLLENTIRPIWKAIGEEIVLIARKQE